MCENCKKQKRVKDKCAKCRKKHIHKLSAIKVKGIKGRVLMYTLAARKPGVNNVGKNIR